MTDLDFMGCDTCRAKPGSPDLCQGCYHNRRVIDDLTSKLRVFDTLLDYFKLLLSSRFTGPEDHDKNSTAGAIFTIMRNRIKEAGL